MLTRPTHRKVIAGITILAASFLTGKVIWHFTPRFRGQAMARIDITRGKREIKGFGTPSLNSFYYVDNLKSKYNIEYNRVAGCFVTDQVVAYCDGYNFVMSNHLKSKFGKDVLDECWQDTFVQVKQESTSTTEAPNP